MIKKCLFALLCVLPLALNAQNINDYMPVESSSKPNAVSSSGSDIVNVDLFTGIGNVTIPIYSYGLEGMDFGISLSYNTKGIQVDQQASSVGLGWTLNASGSIYREANSLEDELSIRRSDTTVGGSFLHFGKFSFQHVGQTQYDKEADVFNINFGGRSIKAMFTWPDTSIVVTSPKSEISIRPISTHYTVSNYYEDEYWASVIPYISYSYINPHKQQEPLGDEMSFHLIDEKGNQFFFRPGEIQLKEYNIAGSDSTAKWATNKWVLTKVQTNNGSEIVYNYKRKYMTYTVDIRDEVTEHIKTTGAAPNPNIEYNPGIYETWEGYISHLSSIEYPNGTVVTFHTDTAHNARCDLEGAYVVDSITVEKKYDNDCGNSLTYKFNYDYQLTPYSPDLATSAAHRTPCNSLYPNQSSPIYITHSRLRLNSIDKVGNDHIFNERYYSFEYHSEPLPGKFAFEQDYYGYYNNGQIDGGPNNVPLRVPYHQFNDNNGNVYYYGTDKTPDNSNDLQYVKASLLKTIKNGLGGKVIINYDQPIFSNVESCPYGTYSYYDLDNSLVSNCTIDPELVGQTAPDGLIVTSVEINDGISNDFRTITEYSYSGGQRFYKGGYFWYPGKVARTTSGTLSYIGISSKVYTNDFVSPHVNIRGSNHGYSEVTVTTKNLSTSEQLSKSTYVFSNLHLPDSLSDLFDTSYLSVYELSNIKISNTPTPMMGGATNIRLKTGIRYHTAKPHLFEDQFIGLLLSKTDYFQNDVIAKVENKYELNPYAPNGSRYNRQGDNRRFYFETVDNNGASVPCSASGTSCWWGVNGYTSPSNATMRVKRTIQKRMSGGKEMTTTTIYTYDFKDDIKSIQWNDSKGDILVKEYEDTWDRSTCDTCLKNALQHRLVERLIRKKPGLSSAYDRVINHRVLVPTLSQQVPCYPSDLSSAKGGGLWFLPTLGNTEFVWNYNYIRYVPKVTFNSVYESAIPDPITLSAAASDESGALSGNYGVPSLIKVKEYTQRDGMSNVLEVRLNELDRYNSFVWDTRIGHKVAEVTNAKHNEIAYTSFEGFTVASTEVNDYGNWEFDENGVEYAPNSAKGKAMTGKYVYHLDYGNSANTISTTLQMNTDYVLTFWSDVIPIVKIGGVTQTLTKVHNGWNTLGYDLYMLKFSTTGSQPALTIEDNSPLVNQGFIDELRLHPADATMTTTTYEPLFGVSSVCDSRNNIVYTEYDQLGRQTIVRDIKGNILSKTERKFQTTNN